MRVASSQKCHRYSTGGFGLRKIIFLGALFASLLQSGKTSRVDLDKGSARKLLQGDDRGYFELNGVTNYYATPNVAGSGSLSTDVSLGETVDGTVQLGVGLAAAGTSTVALRTGINSIDKYLDNLPEAVSGAYVTVPANIEWTKFPSFGYAFAEGLGDAYSTSQGFFSVNEIGYNPISQNFGISTDLTNAGATNVLSSDSVLPIQYGLSGVEMFGVADSKSMFTQGRAGQNSEAIAYPSNILNPVTPVTCTQILIQGTTISGYDLGFPAEPLPRPDVPLSIPFCLNIFNFQTLDDFASFLELYGYDYDEDGDGAADGDTEAKAQASKTPDAFNMPTMARAADGDNGELKDMLRGVALNHQGQGGKGARAGRRAGGMGGRRGASTQSDATKPADRIKALDNSDKMGSPGRAPQRQGVGMNRPDNSQRSPKPKGNIVEQRAARAFLGDNQPGATGGQAGLVSDHSQGIAAQSPLTRQSLGRMTEEAAAARKYAKLPTEPTVNQLRKQYGLGPVNKTATAGLSPQLKALYNALPKNMADALVQRIKTDPLSRLAFDTGEIVSNTTAGIGRNAALAAQTVLDQTWNNTVEGAYNLTNLGLSGGVATVNAFAPLNKVRTGLRKGVYDSFANVSQALVDTTQKTLTQNLPKEERQEFLSSRAQTRAQQGRGATKKRKGMFTGANSP